MQLIYAKEIACNKDNEKILIFYKMIYIIRISD
jgi:hypothetical protein